MHRLLRFGSLSDSRIVERLASGGWREEITSHKQEYLRCIIRMEGACVARPLPEKGTSTHCIMQEISDLRTTFSVVRDEWRGTPRNA